MLELQQKRSTPSIRQSPLKHNNYDLNEVVFQEPSRFNQSRAVRKSRERQLVRISEPDAVLSAIDPAPAMRELNKSLVDQSHRRSSSNGSFAMPRYMETKTKNKQIYEKWLNHYNRLQNASKE